MTLIKRFRMNAWKAALATASAVVFGTAGLSQAQAPSATNVTPAAPVTSAPQGDMLPMMGPAANGGTDDPSRFWLNSEYLLWWVRGQNLPPLVTTSPAGTPQALAGLLGQPTTTVLYGNSRVNDDSRSGFRFTVGSWLDCDHHWAIGAEYFMLENEATHFHADSTGTPILARPFFDVLAGAPARELIAFPGVASGNVNVGTSMQLLGAGVFLEGNLCCGCGYRVDGIVGYRYLQLKEGLGIDENVTSTAVGFNVPPVGTTFNVLDQFNTENEFNGVDLGLLSHWERGRLSLNLLTKVALGDTEREVNINGRTIIAVPGVPPQTFSGGLLALGTNIGNHRSNTFSVVPELRIDVGYQITEHLRAFIGYDFLYWTDVARPGDQVNLNINTNNIPPVIPGGPAQPAFQLHESSFWAQGINFGLGIRF
ncbi:MAG TPA: BBP7 family outer membrane beta-barrel protein [Gemmataceae bacterium]|nr:BBP7 family outer membrane beta-barrel protein [Gemmataceae bacterium]